MSHSKRAFSRTFVLLDRRIEAVPSKPYWERLANGGRVKEIVFTKNTTAAQIGDKIKDSFPSLAGSDLNRLEFIVSYSKGHSMQTVATGPQDGAKIVDIYGGVRKKKVFLYFSSVTHAAASSTSTGVTPSSTQATITSTYPSSSTTSSSTTSSTTLSSTSSTTLSSTSTTSSSSSSTASPTPTRSLSTTTMIDLTTPPTDGASTRRYLTALASASGPLSDMYADISSDEGVDEIMEFCGQNTTDNMDAQLYGYVTDDFTTAGVMSDDHNILSRTSEVLQCLEVLNEGCDGETVLLPFLTHTFEEICWQAYDDRRAIVIVLFNSHNQSQFRGTMLSVLQKVQERSTQHDWYFWAAETMSKNGKRVLDMYGNGTDDQLIFLAPSTQQTPVFVDRIDGPALTDFDYTRLCERIHVMIQGLSMEREQREQWRELRRQQQEIELQQLAPTTQQLSEVNVQEKEREKEIREARLARVSKEPTQGHTVHVTTPIGGVSRMFSMGSHYQEVYDWVGAQNEMPLHFTLHPCGDTSEVIRHDHCISANEMVYLTERDEQEWTTLLKDEVSFKGNCARDVLEELSETLVDEGSEEEMKPAEKAEEKHKRKRKDNRKTTERRKKHKTERKESMK